MALVAFAVSMTALFAIAAIAIDIGRIADTATEVQNVADVAATAAAASLFRGRSTSMARAEAQTAVAPNSVAGSAGTIQSTDVHFGLYEPQTGTWIENWDPPSAVKTTPTVTVPNFFAGYFGSSYLNTTTSKTAIAGFVGLGQVCRPGQPCPTLPYALGDCSFPQLPTCFGNNLCLPALTTAIGGWTSFYDAPTNPSNVEPYFPPCGNGSGQLPPPITIGDASTTHIHVTNGNITPLLRDVKRCFDQGIWQPNVTRFLIPIVNRCGSLNGDANVVGFATVVISGVGLPDTMTLQAVFQGVSGAPGGGNFGTGAIRMLN